jgi:DNA-binding transcriptional MerR regulator
MNEDLTIGRLAKEAGVNVETIRYYQRRGLLKEPAKPMGSHRRYSFARRDAFASSSGRSSLDSRWTR